MKEKWYSPHRHRVRIYSLPTLLEKYHGSKIPALAFRDECLAAMTELRTLVKSKDVGAKNLKTRFDHADWAYITAAIKVEIPVEIRTLIQWENPNKVEQVKTSDTTTVSELVMAHLIARGEEGKPVSAADMSGYDYWIGKAKIRTVLCSELNRNHLAGERDKMVNGYKSKLNKRAPSTVNGIFSVLSTAWDRIMTSAGGTHTIHIPKQLKYLPNTKVEHTQAYTQDEVDKMISLAYEADESARADVSDTGERRRTTFQYLGPLITVLAETGIRSSFLTSLKLSECDLICKTPYVVKRMKRDRLVNIPLSELAISILQQQLLDPDVQESGYFFPLRTRTGKLGPVTTNWTKRFVNLLKDNGLVITSKPVHSFRAYAATRLRDLGLQVSDIADMLGIDQVSAKIYITQTQKQLGNLAAALNDDPHSARRVAMVNAQRRKHQDKIDSINGDNVLTGRF